MRISLKYGRTTHSVDLDSQAAHVAVLTSGRARPECDETTLVQNALAQPIGSPRLAELVSRGQRVAIVTSDVTRPCPSGLLLPHLLNELNRGGVRDENITVVFGLGTHRPHSKAEQLQLVSERVFRRVRCVDSNPCDCTFAGVTRRGTPVSIFRPVMEADVRVCVGNIEYHYFAGYSGGAKAIVPGVAGVETIQHNHRRMTEPGALAGHLDDNPVRCDIDEAGEMVGVHFILNAILDEDKAVVSVVAGAARAAHREGCKRLDAFGMATIDQLVDVVIVSAGGYPKDINLYQAQKALDNARHIVRPGGVIILVAECGEGMGSRVFEEWMREPGGPDAIIARIQNQFVIGGHKAAAIAMTMKRAEVGLVSGLPALELRAMGFTPFDNLAEATRYALNKFDAPRVAIMPEGGAVVPCVKSSLSICDSHNKKGEET
ncbi:MAG: nickel-dependent lactate racemase [Thermoflexales bacterium]|nr:nickel-dependent lactate racemase [Thermoflexales bacterium]